MIYFIGNYFNEMDEYENTLPEYISCQLMMKYETLNIDNKKIIENLIQNKFEKFSILITNNYSKDDIYKIKEIAKKKKLYYLDVNIKSDNIADRSYEVLEILENNTVNNYKKLSLVYDQMQDRMEYDMYLPVLDKFIEKGNFLELGAGSGMVTTYLCDYNLNILATDLCEEFLNKLKSKNLSTIQGKVNTKIVDIVKLKTYEFEKKFDYIGMFLDTLNYIDIIYLKDVFKNISMILAQNGKFIFDIHKEEKLDIFHGYTEEVEFEDFKFHWLSLRESEHCVEHNFMFINDELSVEKHYQYIYSLKDYQTLYIQYFKELEVIELEDRYIIVLEPLK